MSESSEKVYFSEGIASIGNLFPDVQSSVTQYAGVENAWKLVSRAFSRTGNALRLSIHNSFEGL